MRRGAAPVAGLLAIATLAAGCAAPCPAEAPAGRANLGPPPTSKLSTRPATAPLAALSLSVEATPSGRPVISFHLSLRAGTPAELRALELEGDAASVRVVSALDAAGELAVAVETTAPGRTTLRASRDPSPPYELVYEVAAPPPPTTPAPALSADENFARVPGEWIALPRALDDRVLDVQLSLGKVGGQPAPGASSLAAAPEFRGPLRVGALRRSYSLLGHVGTARFEAYEGNDHAVWQGFTSFDPRWVAAESAGVRSALDRWMGAKAGPPHALVFVAERRRGGPFSMHDLAGGLWIGADLSAPWDAEARVRVAQHYAQRFFGGALAIGPRDGPRAEAGRFWSEGVARVVGREVAFELGLLSFDELAGDLNVALGELTLSSLATADLDALVTEVAAGGVKATEARRALAARGVVWASGLDARLRASSKGAKSLRDVMRGVFAAAAKAEASTWSLDDLEASVAATAGPEERRHLQSVVRRGGAPDAGLPEGAAGTCHRLERKPLARYELGFTFDALPAAEGATDLGKVREVVAGSAADRAGLRAGDALVSATYSEGRPDVKAKVVVRRPASKDGREVTLAFHPRGVEREGPIFVRKRGARDESCVR